jgi:hypothetical protein
MNRDTRMWVIPENIASVSDHRVECIFLRVEELIPWFIRSERSHVKLTQELVIIINQITDAA